MMLQGLRENLKGAVAIFVLMIFIVPLVLFGVEQLFVGSAGGNDVAEVNGEGISSLQLQREIESEKMRLQQQFNIPLTDSRLDDSNLRGPALNRLTQRNALVQALEKGNMSVEKDQLWKNIVEMEAFQVDGKFDYDLFKARISNFYTPATFLNAMSKDYLLQQFNSGLVGSAFVTPADIELIAAITQQKRSFFSIDIPKSSIGEVTVSADEVQAYYESNSENYREPETVSIQYIELSLDKLAEKHPPSESDIEAAYEMEVSEFNADPKVKVAHILVEDSDDSAATIENIERGLKQDKDFAELAKLYSDDLGSKESGGELGELVADAFPSEFVEAAQSLGEGEISPPVKTEAGTHFIKVLAIDNAAPPTYEERKEALTQILAKQAAREDFVTSMEELDKLTFGEDNLEKAAESLGLQVSTSEPFTRTGGEGIASSQEVVNAAFAEDVLKQGQNSRVIELPDEKAVVLRLEKYNESYLKPLDSVAETIKSQLKTEKTAKLLGEAADTVLADLREGSLPQEVASAAQYPINEYGEVERSNFEIPRAIINRVFSLARPQSGAVFDKVQTSDGYSVVGLTDVQDGTVEDLAAEELAGIKNQFGYQVGQMEMADLETAIVGDAKIDIK